jgi:uncharacterized protein YndB with AHSA1/START domain
MSDVSPEKADALVFECDLDAPPEKVWRAIATPEIRQAWLGEPDAGPSQVTRADPGERLDLSWPTRDGDSLVSFVITPGEDGGAHLTIVHRALAPTVALFRPRRQPAISASGWRMAA